MAATTFGWVMEFIHACQRAPLHYGWGKEDAVSNTYDCSGFAWALMQHIGCVLPRRSSVWYWENGSVNQSASGEPAIISYPGHCGVIFNNDTVVDLAADEGGATIRMMSLLRFKERMKFALGQEPSNRMFYYPPRSESWT